MSFLNYFQSASSLYGDIYELLFRASSIPSALNEEGYRELVGKCKDFQNIQTQYVDLVGASVKPEVIIEPESWQKAASAEGPLTVHNHGRVYATFNLSFYVDTPKLNTYGLVIEERGVQNHYKFEQSRTCETEHCVKLASDVNIAFTDGLVDQIRSGAVASRGRLRLVYDTDTNALLRLPFHTERLFVHDQAWVSSVLNSMDYEIQLIKERVLKKQVAAGSGSGGGGSGSGSTGSGRPALKTTTDTFYDTS